MITMKPTLLTALVLAPLVLSCSSGSGDRPGKTGSVKVPTDSALWPGRGRAHPRRVMRLVLLLCLLGCGSAAAVRAEAEASWRPLWNGRDLSEWTVWLAKPHATVDVAGVPKDEKGNYTEPVGSRDPLHVFRVVPEVDGAPAIRVSGQVFGELRSRESLTNYHLRLQFKWGTKKWPPREKPETKRDSGLLYHVHAEPGAEGRVWARSIELQIQERDVGDLYAVGSEISVRATRRPGRSMLYDYDPRGDWHLFSQVPGQQGRCIKQPDAEKPSGEWNTIELICLGEESIHIVNGTVVMRLHGPIRIDRPTREPVTAGPILLQSEGAEVFYRALEWRPITAVPAEFAGR